MTQKQTIAVLGKKFNHRTERLSIDRLNFFSRNPRIQWVLEMQQCLSNYSEQMRQETIFELLQSEESVKNLIREIRKDGGVQEPIIVNEDTLTVIEGNSRLAVYRMFNQCGPDNPEWRSILCALIQDLSEEEEDRIVSQAHLQGRTAWSKGAQAYYYYRRRRMGLTDQTNIADLTEDNIKKKIQAIDLMYKNHDHNTNNFDKYQALVSSRVYRDVKQNEDFHQTILEQIRETDDFSPHDIKYKLPTMQKDPDAVQRFIKRSMNLHEAFEYAKLKNLILALKEALMLLRGIKDGDECQLDFKNCDIAFRVLSEIGQEQRRLKENFENRIRDLVRVR